MADALRISGNEAAHGVNFQYRIKMQKIFWSLRMLIGICIYVSRKVRPV